MTMAKRMVVCWAVVVCIWTTPVVYFAHLAAPSITGNAKVKTLGEIYYTHRDPCNEMAQKWVDKIARICAGSDE